MWVLEQRVKGALMGENDADGAISLALGARLHTGTYKGVHAMNDLAQTALGGTPAHRGDVLAAAAREPIKTENEDARDAATRLDRRWGARYAAAFPAELDPADVVRVRAALRAVATKDGGLYRPGDAMNSPLAAHIGLLGADSVNLGVGLGRYLFHVLDQEGQEAVRTAYTDPSDPVSRALRPLLFDDPRTELRRPLPPLELRGFDKALGRGLSTLLRHRLSKLTRLRYLLLAGALGFTLRALGQGRPDGRPAVLATAGGDDDGRDRRRSDARRVATASYARGLDGLDGVIAAHLWAELQRSGGLRDGSAPANGLTVTEASPRGVLDAARAADIDGVYWPATALKAFGRRCGFIEPRSDRAGWPARLHLTDELVEALILMFSRPGQPPRRWRDLWMEVGEALGLHIGANPSVDAARLREVGVEDAHRAALEDNNEQALRAAITQGVARRLPDSGAEAGGELQ
ncbi:MAG: hypothetical protein JNM72_27435 [Deltaproteobacteria bacterium]|nr:hypothetical protein [Deltaproteobacteria bacterium]